MPLLSSSRRLQSAAERNRSRPTHSQPSDAPAELPEYEPPAFPLTDESRRALSQIASNKDTRKYGEQLNKSIDLLSASVRDLNDKYAERKEHLRTLREKRGEDGEKNERERAEEKAVLMLKSTIPQLTTECDQAVRNAIDLKVELEDSSKALKETERQLETEMTNVADNRAGRGSDDDHDEDIPDADLPDIVGPLQLLRKAKEQAASDYALRSLYEKYGLSNDYIGFKRLWHDAVERDGKPLPDASRWFTEAGSHDEAGDDEDLIIAEEHVDVRCPLSMVVMEDPYTCQICKHTFEKNSITQFLRSQPGGRAQCPQTGCVKQISIQDFQPDPVMLRKIKRRLAAQHANMGEDDDEDEEDGGLDIQTAPSQRIKSEHGGKGRSRHSTEDIEDEEDDREEG
ncbi:zinc-finger of the MIZ type in Nse subunit-domain-containing protein [Hypoxylon sp. FL1150]|nr:zinc-finger of the MIZ type in Nse subunit-domain-containing protein [Hypoxylon sp. FL1150]